PLVKNIVKMVVEEVVQDLRTVQEKQQKHRSYLCHSGLKKAIFVLLEESVIDEKVIEEYDNKRKKNRIISKMNEKKINRNKPDKEYIPDIQIVDNEDLE
ncbi:17454_t:CDS:2, partial [Racocetra persica]